MTAISKTRLIRKTIIDVCPVLVLGLDENERYIKQTSLYHYTYNWPIQGKDGRQKIAQAIIFGLGSMFNHSTHNQNVVWERGPETVTYRALRDIQPGEELCISYGNHLTFQDAEAPQHEEEDINQLNQIELD